MKTWAHLLGVPAVMVIAGCAGVANNTPSGRPEIALNNVSTAKAKSYLAETMINEGYSLEKDSQYQMSFFKPGKGSSAGPSRSTNNLFDHRPRPQHAHCCRNCVRCWAWKLSRKDYASQQHQLGYWNSAASCAGATTLRARRPEELERRFVAQIRLLQPVKTSEGQSCRTSKEATAMTVL